MIGQLEEGAETALETAGIGLIVSTTERLFVDGSAHIYRQGGSETIDLYCHVVEGSWCYFVPQGRLVSKLYLSSQLRNLKSLFKCALKLETLLPLDKSSDDQITIKFNRFSGSERFVLHDYAIRNAGGFFCWFYLFFYIFWSYGGLYAMTGSG